VCHAVAAALDISTHRCVVNPLLTSCSAALHAVRCGAGVSLYGAKAHEQPLQLVSTKSRTASCGYACIIIASAQLHATCHRQRAENAFFEEGRLWNRTLGWS
jgi:hypothetical protein